MSKLFLMAVIPAFFSSITWANVDLTPNNNVPMGCIVSVETGQQYCLPVGQRSDYSLPDWINNQEVYVQAAPGTKVLLSDWDNLSYDRIGEFVGTVETVQLKNVTAWNGEKLDFSKPRSMRVTDSGVPLGCIITTATKQQYCLPAGQRSDYSLPDWIYNQEVYVQAAPGTKVLLSDWDNLSYDRIGEFVGTVEAAQLNNVTAWNGEKLNFSKPLSMRVVSQ